VKEVTVRLWADASTLSAQIEDRGVGFGHRRGARRGSGLDGMKERAALLGGVLRIESPPDGGVRITAELPLADPRAPVDER
jgi:signal transduction histidine kinase